VLCCSFITADTDFLQLRRTSPLVYTILGLINKLLCTNHQTPLQDSHRVVYRCLVGFCWLVATITRFMCGTRWKSNTMVSVFIINYLNIYNTIWYINRKLWVITRLIYDAMSLINKCWSTNNNDPNLWRFNLN